MRVLWLSAIVVLVDQVTKLLIRMNMYPGESIPLVGSWLRFTYTENPGMAFGLSFGPKVVVTIFSIVATVLILIYLYFMRETHLGYRLSLAAIFGGAVGNIIDRVFYAVFFNYGGYFEGQVVDFLHIDLWQGFVDLPLMGPKYFALFPIGNVADVAIVIGVVAILAFHRKFQDSLMSESQQEAEKADTSAEAPASPDSKVSFLAPVSR